MMLMFMYIGMCLQYTADVCVLMDLLDHAGLVDTFLDTHSQSPQLVAAQVTATASCIAVPTPGTWVPVDLVWQQPASLLSACSCAHAYANCMPCALHPCHRKFNETILGICRLQQPALQITNSQQAAAFTDRAGTVLAVLMCPAG
jgi:hypothetical protein